MSEDRWLRVAEICCGAERRRSVFEPLIADWLRQWRESRGLRRAWVMASGVAAFVRSLVACFDAIQLAHSKPTMAPVLTLVVFTFAAVAVQSLPFHYTWRPWQWSEVEYGWMPADFDGLWLVPRYVGVAVVVAVLPAAMLASASRWPWRKWITGAIVSATLLLTVNLWLAPRSELIRIERRYASVEHAAPRISRDMTSELRTQARTLAAMTGLVLLGTAAGRARAIAHASLSINALGVWWIFGWMALALLSFWSVQLRIVLGTRAALLLWLPQLTLVFVGAAALWLQRSRVLRV